MRSAFRPVLLSIHPEGGAVNEYVVDGLPLCKAPSTSVGRGLIGPYPMQVGVQPDLACLHLYNN